LTGDERSMGCGSGPFWALSRWRDQIREPVEELKQREFDDEPE
jgi:hypothetical protein